MEPQEWYASIPVVTKTLFTGAVVTTLAGNFGVVSPYSLLLDYSSIWHNFEIWRLITGVFFFGKLGFPFLINVYFLYTYSERLERGLFDRKTADYIFLVLVVWATLLLVAFFLGLPLLGVPLVIAILYVWCNVNADTIVSFWFGTKFKAMYLPWVLAGFNILLGGSGFAEFIGIFAGHVYYFFKYKVPETGGADWLVTPQFLKNWFPETGAGFGGFGDAPPPARGRQPAAAARTFTGNGFRLGDG